MKERTGCDFSGRVCRLVKQIPAGKVATYGQIAAQLGNPKAARAVGNALHSNPDPKNIPCHRVVNKSGRLVTGYAFGGPKEQKRKLLAEGVKFKDRNHVDLGKSLWRSF